MATPETARPSRSAHKSAKRPTSPTIPIAVEQRQRKATPRAHRGRNGQVAKAAPLPQFHTVANLRVTQDALNDFHGSFALGMLFALCSYEEVPYGKYPDVYPMPRQSNRAGSKLLFKIGTDELVAETASGWKFAEGDLLEVSPKESDDLRPVHGDLAVAIEIDRLILVELRSYKLAGKLMIGPFELRNGTLLDENYVVLVGRVREFRRSYWGPDTVEKRATEAMLKTTMARERSIKGGNGLS